MNAFVNFQESINNEDLIDIGAIASGFGGKDGDTTCKANSKSKATRRDSVVANSVAKELIDSMVVDHYVNFPVRDVIRVTFKQSAPQHRHNAVKLPGSLKELLHKVLYRDFGEDNIAKQASKRTCKQMQARLLPAMWR